MFDVYFLRVYDYTAGQSSEFIFNRLRPKKITPQVKCQQTCIFFKASITTSGPEHQISEYTRQLVIGE